ncbi:iron complex outermembrane recepter protein [Sinomicrobium oceani]|uniref:Iron complex outermembrane recepter protein n=2 Tax=Sinomicrobium oceani TaxID=1150368 RepID=A0A1K1M782_9FLAO|nr:iron complex outermembrane recepter protein [Sinomicrobium oceani]
MTDKILAVWFSIGLSLLSFAQTSSTVKGVVVDAQTQTPVSGANIIGDRLYAVSSENGEFTLENVGTGTVIKVTHLGYSPAFVTIPADHRDRRIVVQLTETNTKLEEVQVVGNAKERSTRKFPLSTVEASGAFLEANRENSLMQTLSKIPGVSTINIGSGQSKPVIRGLGFNRVSVVQNGVKHEAQQWGNDHGLEIDQYGIEHIRIIKGPASLLYGSDAIAGVVDLQAPKIPEARSFTGEVNLLGESNNNLFGVSAGVQSRKDRWFYRARFTYRDYADYKVPADRINYESYIFELHKNRLRNTAGNEVNGAFSIGYIGSNIKSETFFSNVYAKNGFFANAHGLEVRTSSIDYDRSERDIDLPFHLVNHFKVINNTTFYEGQHTIDLELGFQNNHREEHSEPVPHGYMPKPDHSKERVFDKTTFSLNARNTFTPHEKHRVVFGINTEFQNNNISGWGFLIPKYNRFTAGIFAYDHIAISDKLSFQGGLRYDFGLVDTRPYVDWFPSTVKQSDGSTSSVYVQRAQHKNLRFGNISGSAGISYTTKNTSYKLHIGKSFRMPLSNELASDGVNYHMFRYEKGNLDLDPEASYQLDIDVDHNTKNFSLGISPFVNFFENFIYLNPTPNYYETVQIYEYTQSKVFRIGGELRFGYALTENLRMDASAEYVHSRQLNGPKKNFTLPFSPPFSGLISGNYQFRKDLLCFRHLQVTADYRITAKQDEIVPPENTTDGYQVLNLSVMSDLDLFSSLKQVQLRFKLNNVFNTRYFNHTSFYRMIDVPEAGRNVSLSLTIPF